MGETFVAIDLERDEKVCIKRLRPDFARELLVQEWRSLARIDSPFVVRYLDRYEADGVLHIVMEYVDGPTLAEFLKTPLNLDAWKSLAIGLAKGLRTLHEQNVIHCDLKPDNVLIDNHRAGLPWTPRIIDFGLAVLDSRDADGMLTAEGRPAGTPAFMAPEQIHAARLTPACDIYALGLILLEAITGRRAFPGRSFSIVGAKLKQRDPLRIVDPRFAVPPQMAELVELCTHPLPEKRPTAARLTDLLQAIDESEVVLRTAPPENTNGPMFQPRHAPIPHNEPINLGPSVDSVLSAPSEIQSAMAGTARRNFWKGVRVGFAVATVSAIAVLWAML
jgi:eukaryotic-like serine/threonine-protein kinase